MRKKILSVLLLGLFTVASTSTLVSCKDYDDDIKNLQEQITANDATLKKLVEDKYQLALAEVKKVDDALELAKKHCEDADKQLQANIEAAEKAAKKYADDGDAATLAAAKKAVDDAMVQVAATYATKAELDDAKKDLEKAIETAKNDLNNRIDDEVKKLMDADDALQKGIDKAQAKADEAYKLAETIRDTYATKKELADAIDGLRKELNVKISANADDIKALQGRMSKAEASLLKDSAAIKALQDLTAEHSATLIALKSDVKNHEDSLKLIDAKVKANFATLRTAIDSLKAAHNEAVKDLTKKITNTNVRIDSLNSAMNTQLNAIRDRLTKVENRVTTLEAQVKAIQEELVKVNGKLQILFNDLNALITSIIYNAQTENISLYNIVAEDVIFPYAGREGADSLELKQGQALVKEEGGLLYATINPAEVDFSGDITVKLINSQNVEHAIYELGAAEGVTKNDPVLTITRAQAENLGNGLYKLPVLTKNGGIFAKDALVGKNSIFAVAPNGQTANQCIAYALQTSYVQVDTAGVKQTRNVTSHYDVAIVPTAVTPLEAINIIPDATGVDTEAEPVKFDIRFDREVDAQLAGKIVLEDITNADVFATYLEVDTTFADATKKVTLSTNEIARGKNVGDSITISVTDNLVNVPVPVKWYALNYDGSIVTKREYVVFTRSKFGTINLELTSTINKSGTMEVDFLPELKKALDAKGADAYKEFCKDIVAIDTAQGQDSIRLVLEAVAGQDTTNVFYYNPKKCNQTVENDKQQFNSIEVYTSEGLQVATISWTVNIVDPNYLDNIDMRIASAFNVIDQDEDYSKDYTVAWARIDQTNADTTKVNYLWDTHSFNIDRFLDAAEAAEDPLTETELTYEAKTKYVPYNQLLLNNQYATDSVPVQNIRVYTGNGIEAKNTNPGSAPAGANDKTLFQIDQIINYYGIIPKVHDTFWYSVVSPINYGIWRGGAKSVEATANNVGAATASLAAFSWVDYSNNKATFNLKDKRIASVTCELVKDAANNYALVENKEIKVNLTTSTPQLEFKINYGAATDNCKLTVNVIVTDYWGIQTKLTATINVKKSEAGAKKF